jgi:hypothetical protein
VQDVRARRLGCLFMSSDHVLDPGHLGGEEGREGRREGGRGES